MHFFPHPFETTFAETCLVLLIVKFKHAYLLKTLIFRLPSPYLNTF